MKKQTKVWLSILLLIIVVISGLYIINFLYFSSHGDFGLYFVENGELIISDKEIISYNKTIHEIKLTEIGIVKLKEMDLYQKKFEIKLNGIEMYEGAFWSNLSSRIYEGIVILDILSIQEDVADTLTIELWYPPTLFKGTEDPRINTDIFGHFQKIGKLTQ